MMASHFYTISAATKSIKHLYYHIIQNSCIILTYNNPDWFCSVHSGISMLLPLGLTHSWCSNASTAFPLQECERESQNPLHLLPPLPQPHYIASTWWKISRMVPAKQQSQTEESRGGVCLERDTSCRLSKPATHCINDLSLIQCFCFLIFSYDSNISIHFSQG